MTQRRTDVGRVGRASAFHDGVLVGGVYVYFACRRCKRLLTAEQWADDCPGDRA